MQTARQIKALALFVWLTAAVVVGALRTRAADDSGTSGNRAIASNGKMHRREPAAAPTPLALPADVKVPSYTPGFFPFHDGERLVYEASWLGIPAARGWFELRRNK